MYIADVSITAPKLFIRVTLLSRYNIFKGEVSLQNWKISKNLIKETQSINILVKLQKYNLYILPSCLISLFAYVKKKLLLYFIVFFLSNHK